MKKKLLLLYFLMATFIANTQNVGIGTLSPNAKLSVSATGTDLAGTAMSNNFRTNAGSLGGSTGNEISLASIGFIAGSNNTSLGIRAWRNSAGTGWSNTALLLEYDVDNTVRAGSGFLALNANGNIGIGTTSPEEKLTILSADNYSVTNIGAFYPNNLSQGIGIGYDEIRKIGTTANSNLFINAKGSGNLILENSATGNVGIGTTNPQKNLSVQNGMNIDQADGNTGSAVNAITFGNNSGEGIGSKRTAGGNQWGLDFYTNSTNKMSITNGGNVGIGTTTTPAAKLEVNGYTKLGSDAPSIKVKKLTATTDATEGGFVIIAHGLSVSKILSVSVLVSPYSNALFPANISGEGFNFKWFINSSGNILVTNVSGDSANILSKPITVLITYEE